MRLLHRAFACGFIAYTSIAVAVAASRENLAERLGYLKDAKLLIIHADDVGMAHSVDRATFYALEHHDVSAASVMVPCPWLTEVADYAKRHSEADLGLHITLNSQFLTFRWGPVAPRDQVPSLLDQFGYLYRATEEIDQHDNAAEVELEVRAQVQAALRMGLRPTHLDDHMNTLESRKDFYAALVKVGHEFHIPFKAVRPFLEERGWISMLSADDIVIDQWLEPNYHVPPEQWTDTYVKMLDRVNPGLNEMIVHVGYDDSELQAITVGRPNWGSAWRQRDFDLVNSAAFQNALRDRKITVIGWKELCRLTHQ